MIPIHPYRGDENDVREVTAKLQAAGFKIRTSMGPENQPFGNMFVQLENGKIRADVIMDRSDVTLVIGPIGNDELMFSPAEWLIVGGISPPEFIMDVHGRANLLCSNLNSLEKMITESSLDSGITDELLDARRQVSDAFEAIRQERSGQNG